ncbi:MAG TPA: beta-L-arabinofuranosidase domain-containing protein, partial [Chloroflexota bacterium]
MTASSTQHGLQPLALQPLPLGAIHPTGWLLRQLRIQADGLSGHLDEFWPDVARSAWIGGDAEGWERGPYWLDGVVPLAFLLMDARLIARVRHWVEYIFDHQHPDGWLGPLLDDRARQGYSYDPWPAFILLKALTQYHGATGEPRVIPAMQRFLRRLQELLTTQPLRSWGRYRWADLVLSIHWLYDRTGEAWLLELAASVQEQGFAWRQHFAHFSIWSRVQHPEIDLSTHVVNNGMAIKAPGVWYRQSGDAADRAAVAQIIATLDRYHGQANGMFSGDEHLAGRSPSQGSELCAVVEYMFSLEALLAALGEPALADRLERLAFNALPATISPDMWTHQYDQQVNQMQCVVMQDRPWTSNGPRANLFGLEPNFGCCTANMHQGWPKFASHLWLRAPDGGLAAGAYAPCTISTEVANVPINVAVETDYPFRDSITIRLRTSQPVSFPLHLRIPAWANGAELRVNNQPAQAATPGTFFRLEQEWSGETIIQLQLPMSPRAEQRDNGAIAVMRGPLLYGLQIGEEWQRLDGEAPAGDFEIHPISPWNYA